MKRRAEECPRRVYRVSALCYEPDLSEALDRRRLRLGERISLLIEKHSPDLIVLPEVCLVPDFDKLPGCGAESLCGETVTLISDIAKQSSTNICVPIIENDGERLFNAAIYVNRNGETAGVYRKHTLTECELDRNILPGPDRPEPVEIDGLRIGTAICFDENYPDLIWNYIEKGIDLLVFPSYTYGGGLIAGWAMNCGVPLVCAFPWESVIYDGDGRILAEGGTWTSTVRFGYHPEWIVSDLDMQSRVFHLDENQTRLSDLYTKYGSDLDVRLMVREARMRITVRSDTLNINDVQEQFGLVPLQAYLSNSRKNSDRVRPSR